METVKGPRERFELAASNCTYPAHHANTVHTVCTGALMHTVHIVHMMHTVLCVPCTFYCALCTVNEQCTMYFAHDAQCEPCTVRSGEIWSKKFEICCTETDGSFYVLRYWTGLTKSKEWEECQE